jgi:rod shape-determining protein MreD
MINIILKNIIRFVLFIFIQIFIVRHIDLGTYFTPQYYIIFLLLLPFETPDWLLIILGFICGYTVDIFNYTPGLNASACVFAAFVRPRILKLIAPRDGYENGMFPEISHMGFLWFTYYSSIIIFLHHCWFFTLEIFRFTNVIQILLKTFASGICTLILVIISQALAYKPLNKR